MTPTPQPAHPVRTVAVSVTGAEVPPSVHEVMVRQLQAHLPMVDDHRAEEAVAAVLGPLGLRPPMGAGWPDPGWCGSSYWSATGQRLWCDVTPAEHAATPHRHESFAAEFTWQNDSPRHLPPGYCTPQ